MRAPIHQIAGCYSLNKYRCSCLSARPSGSQLNGCSRAETRDSSNLTPLLLAERVYLMISRCLAGSRIRARDFCDFIAELDWLSQLSCKLQVSIESRLTDPTNPTDLESTRSTQTLGSHQVVAKRKSGSICSLDTSTGIK